MQFIIKIEEVFHALSLMAVASRSCLAEFRTLLMAEAAFNYEELL
jgi:hypothetical protein